MYDFNHDGKIARNDWLYIDTASGSAFRLMGKTPTSQDAFGWLPLQAIPQDLDIQHPSGYFIFIDFPKDKELYGTNAFSWVYITQDMTFKLMGADENHNFDYLDENGDGRADPLSHISFSMSGSEVSFVYNKSADGTSLNYKKTSCHDEASAIYKGTSFYLKTNSWYQGAIVYNCKIEADQNWELNKTSITITQIQKQEQIDLQINQNRLIATLDIDYEEGVVHAKGSYNGNKFDCYEQYIPILPVTIHKEERSKLEEVMEWTGDDLLIGTNCPTWLENIDTLLNQKINYLKMSRKFNFSHIIDTDGLDHKLYVYQYIKLQGDPEIIQQFIGQKPEED
ncbi:MAG: hypothetical protein C6H99_07435 [Epsilonproteobacteria bacterium]|nr:hypothetical protein [Campylobacterota bacterium]